MANLTVPHSKRSVNGQERGVIDIKSGEICLVLETNGEVVKHKMYMKIFKNSYEHHAQLYTDAEYTSLKYALSMRNCSIQVDEPKKRIAVHVADGSPNISNYLFEVNSAEEILDWVKSLTPDPDLVKGSMFSPASPKRSKVANNSV